MLRIFFYVMYTTVVLSLAASAAAANPAGLCVGEGQPHDPEIISYDAFNADGTFRFEFRKYDDCEIVYHTIEEGSWIREGDLITTQIHKLDGKPAFYSHVYRYEFESDEEMRVRHLGMGDLYVERRVDSFEFPACWFGS